MNSNNHSRLPIRPFLAASIALATLAGCSSPNPAVQSPAELGAMPGDAAVAAQTSEMDLRDQEAGRFVVAFQGLGSQYKTLASRADIRTVRAILRSARLAEPMVNEATGAELGQPEVAMMFRNVPSGEVQLTIEALDADGKVLGDKETEAAVTAGQTTQLDIALKLDADVGGVSADIIIEDAEPTTNPAPSTAPTTQPTAAPTTAPTPKPTVAPTTAPTPQPTVAPTQPPSTAQPLWYNGFENGLGDFHASGANDSGKRPSLVTDRVRDGRYAAMFEMNSGGQRNEVSARSTSDSTLKFTEGEDLYFGASYYFDSSWPTSSDWQIVSQWKQEGTGTPPIQIAAEGNKLVLRGRNWQSGGNPSATMMSTLPRNRWVDVVVHIKFSSSKSTGFAEAWVDGQKVVSKMPWETLQSGRPFSYLKAGIYRDTDVSGSTRLWMDAWRIGRSYEEVVAR